MTPSPRLAPPTRRPARAGTPSFDSYALILGLGVCALWTLGAVPLFVSPRSTGFVLPVFVFATAALTAVAWLDQTRHTAFQPPVAATVVGILAVIVGASVGGQTGALLGMALTVVLAFAWRIVEETGTRFADVAFVVAAVSLFGFLPAQALLLRALPAGGRGFGVFVAAAAAFIVAQAMLARPSVDGTRRADPTTAVAALAAMLVGLVAGVVAGRGFGAVSGLLIGLAVGVGSACGRAALAVLVPTEVVDGRRARRRPMLADAVLPLFFAAPFAYGMVRLLLIR